MYICMYRHIYDYIYIYLFIYLSIECIYIYTYVRDCEGPTVFTNWGSKYLIIDRVSLDKCSQETPQTPGGMHCMPSHYTDELHTCVYTYKYVYMYMYISMHMCVYAYV